MTSSNPSYLVKSPTHNTITLESMVSDMNSRGTQTFSPEHSIFLEGKNESRFLSGR